MTDGAELLPRASRRLRLTSRAHPSRWHHCPALDVDDHAHVLPRFCSDEHGRFIYSLRRTRITPGPIVTVVLLNPASTIGEHHLIDQWHSLFDQHAVLTDRPRELRFAYVFPYVGQEDEALRSPDRDGPGTLGDHHVCRATSTADIVIAAWGAAMGRSEERKRYERLRRILHEKTLHAFGALHNKHPRSLRAFTTPPPLRAYTLP